MSLLSLVLGRVTGTSAIGTIAAIAVSSIAFGVGHLYQGPASAGRIAGFAAVAGAIYVISGSLWSVMILHVVTDIAAGLLGYALLRDHDSTDAASVVREQSPMPPKPRTPRRSPAPGSS